MSQTRKCRCVVSTTYDHTQHSGEKNTSPSLTVPGQAYSVDDVIRRFTRGQSVAGALKQPVYSDKLPPGIENFEFDEAHDFLVNLKQRNELDFKEFTKQQEAIRKARTQVKPESVTDVE